MDFNGTDDFATIGIDNNFMPYYRRDPQYQYVANFNWIRAPITCGSVATSTGKD